MQRNLGSVVKLAGNLESFCVPGSHSHATITAALAGWQPSTANLNLINQVKKSCDDFVLANLAVAQYLKLKLRNFLKSLADK